MLKLLKFSGRAKRARLWQLILIGSALAALSSFLDVVYIAEWLDYLPGESDAGSPLFFTVLAVLVWPIIATAVRRLHDHDKSGWWLLIGFTGIGLVPLLYWFIIKAPKETNRFG